MTVPIDFEGALDRLVQNAHERMGCTEADPDTCGTHGRTRTDGRCPVAWEWAQGHYRRAVHQVVRYWNLSPSPCRGSEAMIDLNEVPAL